MLAVWNFDQWSAGEYDESILEAIIRPKITVLILNEVYCRSKGVMGCILQ